MAEGTIGGTPISELPPSSFAYCEPGDGAVSTRCHFPIRDKAGKADAAHVRNALARLSGSPFEAKARPKVEAAAKELGIGEPAAKSAFDMKAENLTKKRTDLWLDGQVSRRVLWLPFTGPLPGGKAGLDLDGEYFDEETDPYGPFEGLKASKWREMDWHHNDAGVPTDVTGPGLSMKGMLVGEIELDDEPDEFGRWADWWIRQGERNKQRTAAARVAALEQMGQPLYGSSQAVFKQKASDGHIEVWPMYRHTASTAPRNEHAVIPPLKALVDDLTPDDLSSGALAALLVGLSGLVPDLQATFSEGGADTSTLESGEPAAKAGRRNSASDESTLMGAHDAIASVLSMDCAPVKGTDLDTLVAEALARLPTLLNPRERTQ